MVNRVDLNEIRCLSTLVKQIKEEERLTREVVKEYVRTLRELREVLHAKTNSLRSKVEQYNLYQRKSQRTSYSTDSSMNRERTPDSRVFVTAESNKTIDEISIKTESDKSEENTHPNAEVTIEYETFEKSFVEADDPLRIEENTNQNEMLNQNNAEKEMTNNTSSKTNVNETNPVQVISEIGAWLTETNVKRIPINKKSVPSNTFECCNKSERKSEYTRRKRRDRSGRYISSTVQRKLMRNEENEMKERQTEMEKVLQLDHNYTL